MAYFRILSSMYLRGDAEELVNLLGNARAKTAAVPGTMDAIGMMYAFFTQHISVMAEQLRVMESHAVYQNDPGAGVSRLRGRMEVHELLRLMMAVADVQMPAADNSDGGNNKEPETNIVSRSSYLDTVLPFAAAAAETMTPTTTATDQELPAFGIGDCFLWAAFCTRQFGQCIPVRFDINPRAVIWKLMFGIIGGSCTHWEERYTRLHDPAIQTVAEAIQVGMHADILPSYVKTMAADVARTPLKHSMQISLLRIVLHMYVRMHPGIGYFQSMSFVAAALIEQYAPAEVFEMATESLAEGSGKDIGAARLTISDLYSPKTHREDNIIHGLLADVYISLSRVLDQIGGLLVGISARGNVASDATRMDTFCRQLLKKLSLFDPDLHVHICSVADLPPVIIFMPWVETMFAYMLPNEYVFRIWDFLFAGFVSGAPFITRLECTCLAFLSLHRTQLLATTSQHQFAETRQRLTTHPYADTRPIEDIVERAAAFTEMYVRGEFGFKDGFIGARLRDTYI